MKDNYTFKVIHTLPRLITSTEIRILVGYGTKSSGSIGRSHAGLWGCDENWI